MEAKELNLEPVREFIHDLTYDGGYHPEELSTLFRKMAIEFSLLAFFKNAEESILMEPIINYVETLNVLANTFDKIE